jgi:hypothetical protein
LLRQLTPVIFDRVFPSYKRFAKVFVAAHTVTLIVYHRPSPTEELSPHFARHSSAEFRYYGVLLF